MPFRIRCIPRNVAPRAWLFAAGVVLPGWCAETPANEADQPHQLFIGTDLKVPWQGDYAEVARFQDSRVVVRDEDGRAVVLSQAVDFRWERRPKVGRSPLTISNVDHTRLYSIGRDPATKWNNIQTQLSAYQSTQADIATGEYAAVSSGQGPNQATMKRLYGLDSGRMAGMQVPDHGQYSEDLRAGRITLEQVAAAATDSMTQVLDQNLSAPDGEFFRERAREESAEESYDSFELQFDIASREPIADAHAVISARVVTKDAPEGGMVIFPQRLGKLDTNSRRFKVRKAGLADGFKLEEVQVRVFAHGIELGSNLSERSRAISANEARGFLLLAHLTDHRDETLGPQPVWDLAPPELWAANDGADFDFTVVVSLNVHGQILGVHENEAEARASLAAVEVADLRTKRSGPNLRGVEDLIAAETAGRRRDPDQAGQLPARVVALVERMVFMPALEQGVPVPSIATVNLAEFFR